MKGSNKLAVAISLYSFLFTYFDMLNKSWIIIKMINNYQYLWCYGIPANFRLLAIPLDVTLNLSINKYNYWFSHRSNYYPCLLSPLKSKINQLPETITITITWNVNVGSIKLFSLFYYWLILFYLIFFSLLFSSFFFH